MRLISFHLPSRLPSRAGRLPLLATGMLTGLAGSAGAWLLHHRAGNGRRNTGSAPAATTGGHIADLGLATIIETIADGILIVDDAGRYVRVNTAAERMLGVDRRQILGTDLGRPLWRRLTLDGRPYSMDEHPFKRLERGGEPVIGEEFVIERPDGQRFTVSMNGAALQDANGHFAGMVATFEDITARKNAELALRQAQEQLEQRVQDRTVELHSVNKDLQRELIHRHRAQTDLSRLYQQNVELLRLAEQRLAELQVSRQLIITATEDLRRQIAERLHGSVQTKLLLAWHRLGMAEGVLPDHPEQATAILAEVRSDLDHIREEEVREASHQLHPSIIRIGLIPALRSLATQFEDEMEVCVEADERTRALDDPAGNHLPEPLRLAAYRICEEALTNSFHHGHAQHVTVDVTAPDGALHLRVADDGEGFDTTKQVNGLGMSTITSRTELFSGTWSIESTPGHGAVLSVLLPLPAPGDATAMLSPEDTRPAVPL